MLLSIMCASGSVESGRRWVRIQTSLESSEAVSGPLSTGPAPADTNLLAPPWRRTWTRKSIFNLIIVEILGAKEQWPNGQLSSWEYFFSHGNTFSLRVAMVHGRAHSRVPEGRSAGIEGRPGRIEGVGRVCLRERLYACVRNPVSL